MEESGGTLGFSAGGERGVLERVFINEADCVINLTVSLINLRIKLPISTDFIQSRTASKTVIF